MWPIGATAAVLLLIAGVVSTVLAAPGGPVPAAWREQHVDFRYAGRTSRYSCEGLLEKVRGMLLELGARRDLALTPSGCSDVDRRAMSGYARLKIVFRVPALLTAVTPNEGSMRARFVPFVIARDAFRNMGLGDCELVQEFVRQILPRLAVRNLKSDIACFPYPAGGSRYQVRGEVLRILPFEAAPRALER